VRAIVCDDYGGNRAVVSALEDEWIEDPHRVGRRARGSVRELLDRAGERGFRHIGQPELELALRGAQAKPVGDAWAWSRKQSSGDVAAVVALTLALAVGSEIPVGAGEIVIY
jgi:hypothetical protein